MTENENEKLRQRATRESKRAPAPASAHAEIYLEPSPETTPTWLEPAASPLDRRAVAGAMAEIERLAEVHPDEWADEESRLHVLLGDGRLVLRLALFDESKEQLARRLDALFDLGFELGYRLRLDLVEPLLDTALTRHRYESQFSRILDGYHRKARTSAALVDPRAWRAVDDGRGVVVSGDPLAAVEAEPDSVPHAVWVGRRGKRLDPLELSGERATAVLAGLSADKPFLAVLPPGSKPGDTGAILRVRRISNPVPGTALVEAVSEGNYRLRLVTRGPSGVLVRVDL